jgi:hypothetical protein
VKEKIAICSANDVVLATAVILAATFPLESPGYLI